MPFACRPARLRVRFSSRLDGATTNGAGVVVALCRSGGFVAITTPRRPPARAPITLEILGVGASPVTVEATVTGHTIDGVELGITVASVDYLTLLHALGAG